MRLNHEEVIAKQFHDAYEELAPEFNYQTRKASAVPWDDVPEKNRNLMIAVVRRLLAMEVIQAGEYFWT